MFLKKILAEARARVDLTHVRLQSVKQTPRDGEIDLVYCNGVLHHNKLEQRAEALQRIFDSLGPARYFALWENNPLNLGTRFIMAKCPFDRDAMPILPSQATKMVKNDGFSHRNGVVSFFLPEDISFPTSTRALVESDGQYLVLARKP
jgi:hypothetical protein